MSVYCCWVGHSEGLKAPLDALGVLSCVQPLFVEDTRYLRPKPTLDIE